MSPSLLYHAFGLEGYDYIRQSFIAGSVIFWIKPKAKLIRCPECKHRRIIRKGSKERWLRTAPIGDKPVWLCVETPRVECRRCGCLRQISHPSAEPRSWHTKIFKR